MTQPSDTGAADSAVDHGLQAVQDGLQTVSLCVRVGAVLLLAAFCLSGIRNLEQYESAVILRFGAPSGEPRESPGLTLALPFPVDELVRVPARRTHTIASDSYWYQLSEAEAVAASASVPATLTPGVDGMLLTRDGALIHARSTISYTVVDPMRYALGFADLQAMLSRCLDSAVLRTAGGRDASSLMAAKADFARAVEARLQTRLDALGAGVTVSAVDLELSWPRQLTATITAVADERQRQRSALSRANAYADAQINAAESESARIESEARTAATRQTSRAAADAETFRELHPLYRENPDVVRESMRADRIGAVLAQVDEIFVLSPHRQRELRLRLQRYTPPKKQEDEAK
jgi:regulator of protease activity HflC (stomatin/prohibitin superfamily)